MSAEGRQRSLNLQTLEELLGGSSRDPDSQSLGSGVRPPTRHGRESTSSSEENKNPSPSTPSASSVRESWQPKDDFESGDDDFITKLNAMRRRSLITNADPPRVVDKKPKPVIRAPSNIKEESDDDVNNNLNNSLDTTALKTNSRPSSSDSSHTFRVSVPSAEKPPAIPTVTEKKTTSTKPEPKQPLAATFLPNAMKSSDPKHSKWLQKKIEEDRRKRKKQQEEEERKKQEAEERRRNAAKMFERWKADYDEKTRNKLHEMKKKEKARTVAEQKQKAEKQEEALKTFDAWSRERSKSVVDLRKSQKTQKEREEAEKEEEKRKKKEEADKAFQAWKALKELEEEQKKAMDELRERRKEHKEKTGKALRLALAEEAYQTWLQIKEMEEQLRPSRDVETPSVPWIPPSSLVPRQFISTGRRRRSLDSRPRPRSSTLPPRRFVRPTSTKSSK